MRVCVFAKQLKYFDKFYTILPAGSALKLSARDSVAGCQGHTIHCNHLQESGDCTIILSSYPVLVTEDDDES